MSQFSNKIDKKRVQYVIKFDSLVDDIQMARKIEQSIYNYVIKTAKEKTIFRSWDNPIFKNLYNSKIRSIFANMDPTSYIQNPMFFNKIKNNDINVEKIGELSVYDIYPENWVQLINDKMKRDKIKYELKPEAMTDQFKCRKCGSRSTSYYEVQTRSADEPMTQFITCLNCNCRWKQ
jgi:DNA-directed RNA polymerase subunit M/transcription elongation factor TFIIS